MASKSSSSPPRSDPESPNYSSRYIPKFLGLVLIVIFYMVEERAWYADEFHNPTIVAQQHITNNDISFAQSSTVQNTRDSDKSKNNTLENTSKSITEKCREASVKGKEY